MGRQRLIELSNHADIKAHQATIRKQIRESYNTDSSGEATLITKAEFTEQFGPETHEIFGLKSLHKFRQELVKADAGTAEEEFKKACTGLKGYVVEGDNQRNVVYVREKKNVTKS